MLEKEEGAKLNGPDAPKERGENLRDQGDVEGDEVTRIEKQRRGKEPRLKTT